MSSIVSHLKKQNLTLVSCLLSSWISSTVTLVEWSIAIHILCFLTSPSLLNTFQLNFCPQYFTEIPLVKVTNTFPTATLNAQLSVLTISAAADLSGHPLLERFSQDYTVTVNILPLNKFATYFWLCKCSTLRL